MCTTQFLEKVKRTSETLKVKIALPQENEKTSLTGKKSFCKVRGQVRRLGNFPLSGKKQFVAPELKYIKEISLSI